MDNINMVFFSGYQGKTIETEGHDRKDLSLPGKQLELLQAAASYGTASCILCKTCKSKTCVKSFFWIHSYLHWYLNLHLFLCSHISANNAPVLLLLFNAGPLDITWAKENSSVTAIMEGFLPAQAAGDALYQILTMQNGSVPAGRLPVTWPASMAQVGHPFGI